MTNDSARLRLGDPLKPTPSLEQEQMLQHLHAEESATVPDCRDLPWFKAMLSPSLSPADIESRSRPDQAAREIVQQQQQLLALVTKLTAMLQQQHNTIHHLQNRMGELERLYAALRSGDNPVGRSDNSPTAAAAVKPAAVDVWQTALSERS